MPEGFRFLDMEPAAEVISLIAFDRSRLTLDGFNFSSLARLKPGVTVADANADIARMLPIWLNAWPISPNIAGRQVVRELADHAGRAAAEGRSRRRRRRHALDPDGDDRDGAADRLRQRRQSDAGEIREPASGVCACGRRSAHGEAHIAREVLVESLVLSLIGGALGVALAYAGLARRRRDSADDAAARRGHLARSACRWRLPSWSHCSRACCSARFPRLKQAAQHGAPSLARRVARAQAASGSGRAMRWWSCRWRSRSCCSSARA